MIWWPRAILVFVSSLLAFPAVPIALAFARREADRIGPTHAGAKLLPAWRLPRGARWLETQDDRGGLLPAGLYEKAIWDVYLANGWRDAARAWLWRNRAYRFAKSLGVSVPKPAAPFDSADSFSRWATLVSGQPLTLPSLDGLHTIVMQMTGRADPSLGIAGRWEGRIAWQRVDGGGYREVWCRRRVWPAIRGFFPWQQTGWALKPYFDAVRDFPVVDWPDPTSAAGRVSIAFIRTERAVR